MKRILSSLLVAILVICCVFAPLNAFKVSAQEEEPGFSWELSEIRLAEIYNEDNYENDMSSLTGETLCSKNISLYS